MLHKAASITLYHLLKSDDVDLIKALNEVGLQKSILKFNPHFSAIFPLDLVFYENFSKPIQQSKCEQISKGIMI